MNAKSTASATLAILLLSCALTGCATVSSAPAASSLASSALYQPPVLRLPAGRPVQTRDGVHTPPQDEVWHSDSRYRQLEQENIDLAAALHAERKRQP